MTKYTNLTSEEIQLLLAIDDKKSIPANQIFKDSTIGKYPTTLSLQEEGLVEVKDEQIVLSSSGKRLISITRSNLSFKKFIKVLPFVALTKFVDTLVKHCIISGFHLNVPFAGLTDEEFSYVETQVEQAKQKRNNKPAE